MVELLVDGCTVAGMHGHALRHIISHCTMDSDKLPGMMCPTLAQAFASGDLHGHHCGMEHMPQY